jgi:probable phosphoglycerate mutase
MPAEGAVPKSGHAIFLVRHGETVSNTEGRYHGRLDSPLTERGVGQARAIGRRLRLSPDAMRAAIVSSPQPRARRTAEFIRECLGESAPQVQLDEQLCEVSIGRWEGLREAEIAAVAPGTFEGAGRHEWCFSASGRETYEVFKARIAQWLTERSDQACRIVVTHGIVARVLRGLYAGLPRSDALSLLIPQDRIYRLADGIIEEIAVAGAPPVPRICRVAALDGGCLDVAFEDGIAGTIDVVGRFSGGVGCAMEPAGFARVAIDDFGGVCWPGGFGITAQALHDHLTRETRRGGGEKIGGSRD